jgi:pimeloyl-ACP methyl ester carboxylesterase
MKRALIVACCLLSCRAAPIPENERYPAGTPYTASYVQVHGTNLRYLDAGDGAPVLLLHGLGSSMYSWRATIPALVSSGFRVLALDHRGFGSSEKPATGYSNAEYANVTLEFLDSVGVDAAILIGHSMGGQIAAEVALARPDRVRGLALIAPAGSGFAAPLALRVVRWPVIGPIAAALRNRWSTAVVLRSTFADPERVREGDIDQYYAPVAEEDYGRSLRGVLREYRFDALLERADSIRSPTLIIWGDRDRWIPAAAGRKLAARLSRVGFFVVPGGHNLQEESSDSANSLLLTFLTEGLPRIPENLAQVIAW